MSRISEKIWYLVSQTLYAASFGKVGKRSLVYRPIQIDGRRSLFIEDDVYIAQYAWLMGNKKRDEALRIKSGTTLGHYAHIVAIESVVIESNVLIADNVFISDCTHSYENIGIPVIRQDVKILSSVIIGEGSWLGENVCVCGASIGKHCVIGANSVVTTDIPDYCVAVGSPARVVKKYDFEKNEWKKEESYDSNIDWRSRS